MAGLDCTLTTLGGAVPATLSWEREGVALSARQRPGLSTEVVIYFATFFFVIHRYIPLCQIFLNQNFVSWDSSYVDTVYVLYSAERQKSILL